MTSIMMQNESQRLMCLKHNQIAVSINLGKVTIKNSRLLCSQCLIELLNDYPKEKSYILVQIDEFIKDPINQLLSAMKWDGTKQFIETSHLSKLLNEIKLLEVKFQVMIAEITKCVNEIKQLKEIYFTEFQESLKLNSIINQYKKATQLGKGILVDVQRQKEISLFLDQIGHLSGCVEISQHNPKVMRKQESLQNTIQEKLKNIIKDTQRFERDFTNSLKFYNIQGLTQSIFMEFKEFSEIHFQISQEKPIKYELVYQGSAQSLDYQQFHIQHVQKFNLLTVIKTTNGCKAGAYYPIYGILLQDSGFIFQYDRKQIFKFNLLKIKAKCPNGFHVNQVPVFQFVGRKVQLNYQTSQFYDFADNSNSNVAIFGEQNPLISNIKIYKVIFQQ